MIKHFDTLLRKATKVYASRTRRNPLLGLRTWVSQSETRSDPSGEEINSNDLTNEDNYIGIHRYRVLGELFQNHDFFLNLQPQPPTL